MIQNEFSSIVLTSTRLFFQAILSELRVDTSYGVLFTPAVKRPLREDMIDLFKQIVLHDFLNVECLLNVPKLPKSNLGTATREAMMNSLTREHSAGRDFQTCI